MFKLRNYQDLGCFINEVSALIDNTYLLEMYNLATEEAYSFLYCKLISKDINNTFIINQYLTIEDN